jgi:hypothetical protein
MGFFPPFFPSPFGLGGGGMGEMGRMLDLSKLDYSQVLFNPFKTEFTSKADERIGCAAPTHDVLLLCAGT